jgi:solute carrier family 45, member 1/2/4
MGMAIYALSCALFSMTIEKLIKKFTAKKIFVSALLTFAVSMAILGKYPTKFGVLIFSTTAGKK